MISRVMSHDTVHVTPLNGHTAALFMWATQPAFSAAGYVPSILLERPLYYRELNDGLFMPHTYYISKWIQEVCEWLSKGAIVAAGRMVVAL